jgi:hypothetical protein
MRTVVYEPDRSHREIIFTDPKIPVMFSEAEMEDVQQKREYMSSARILSLFFL